MSKQNKKLQAEIQNGLKQVDEGIAQLEILENKVENASTISIKEKYRQDMKREIKRLQRLRDMFRQNVNNPAVNEQHKLVEARKRIETEMEKFRDHEKEYKSKKPTKAAMLNETEIKGKFNYGSGSSFDGDYDNENEEGAASEEEQEIDEGVPDITLDKGWLSNFISDTLRTVIGKYDAELDKIQNKKTKGGQKKNRDKINALKNRKAHLQHIKDRAEELQISMDYLEAGKIRKLRLNSKALMTNSEEESTRMAILNEIDALIELSEVNRRTTANPNSSQGGHSPGGSAQQDGRRVVLEQLELQRGDDIVDDDRPLTSLRIGNILDAQDYLGSWHLSIVINDNTTSGNDANSRTLHFLPFHKANRDETFNQDDQARLAPAFTKQESQSEPQAAVQTLYAYLDKHLKKTGQTAPVGGSTPVQQKHRNQASSQPEETKGPGVSTSSHTKARNGVSANATSADSYNLDQGRNNYSAAGSQSTSHGSLQLQKGAQGKHSKGQNSVSEDPRQGGKRAVATRQTDGTSRDASDASGVREQEDQMRRSLPRTAQQKNVSDSQPATPAGQLQQMTGGLGQSKPDSMQGLSMAPMFTNNFGALGRRLGGEPGSPVFQPLDRQLNPLGADSSAHQNKNGGGVLLGSQSSGGLGGGPLGSQHVAQPQMVKDTTSSERKHNLDLLETSFCNILTKQDQEVIDPKHPMSVWEEHDYPRVPLFNRKENFSRFDLETLFFAFYYQQGTLQQYLAAVELKKKGWKFVKKFETWFKKVESEAQPPSSTAQPSSSTTAQAQPTSQAPGAPQAKPSDGQDATNNPNAPNAQDGSKSAGGAPTIDAAGQKDVGKYIFFDFENGWQQLVRDNFELDLSQIENELIVQPLNTPTAASSPALAPSSLNLSALHPGSIGGGPLSQSQGLTAQQQ